MMLALLTAHPAHTWSDRPLAGGGGWGELNLSDLVMRYGLVGDVRPLGYVSDADLAWLYAGATALVWPSFYEGFGLPPLECMACGTPVITSQAASLPEVVADAGLMVDPRDVDGLTAAMQQILTDATRQPARYFGAEREFGTVAAGHYDIRFDASRLPSGMYIYRLEAGGRVTQHKMLLMK